LPEKPAALPDSPRLEADQAILFTSGTSGQAKGVRLSLGNHLASAAGSAQRLGTLPGDRWLLCMPLFHVGGLAIVLRAAIQGMCVVLEPRFEPEAVLETLTSARINLVSLVPTMLERLLDHAGERALPEDLRGVLLGGGPVPESLLERARALRVPVAPSYGLTEACSQVATMTPAEVREGRNCAGQPLPGVEIRIVGANDLPVDPDQEGEIQVRGAQVMQGYLDQPEATQFTLRDGWLHTGDIGRIDVEGYLTVLDRRQDLIVSGGENVYPAEVEAILLRHPQIRDAAVIGQPDASWGQIVHAFVVVTAGQQLPRQELIQHCRAHLAGFKVPREVSFMGSLPRTPTGKLQRERLRQS
jgi:O-succinylbenzoic acid--CoA ligase